MPAAPAALHAPLLGAGDAACQDGPPPAAGFKGVLWPLSRQAVVLAAYQSLFALAAFVGTSAAAAGASYIVADAGPQKTGGVPRYAAMSLASAGGGSVLADAFDALCGMIGFTVIAVAAAIFAQWAICRLLIKAIEGFDQMFIGTDIEFGGMNVNLFTGRIVVDHFVVYNPKGFKGAYALKVKKFVLDINTWRYVSSLLTEFEIEELRLDGVESILEYDSWVCFCAHSNLNTILEYIGAHKPSERRQIDLPTNDIECIYHWWDTRKQINTFHLFPAREDEEIMGPAFYAYTKHAPGTEPVYAFWNMWTGRYTYHFDKPWTNELRQEIEFYAFPEHARATEPVYWFDNKETKEHSLHMGKPLPTEQQGDIQFYAYGKDPSKRAHKAPEMKQKHKIVQPVWEFWHWGHLEHTYHHLPAWKDETRQSLEYFAYSTQVRGTEPVYNFLSKSRYDHRLHFGEAHDDEERHTVQFYAYPKPRRGAEPVYEFQHSLYMEHTYHFGAPRQHETKKDIAFYAFRDDPTSWIPPCFVVKKVMINDVGGKLHGVRFAVGDLLYFNFTEEFGTHGIRDVICELLKTMLKTVMANLGTNPTGTWKPEKEGDKDQDSSAA